MSDYNINLFTLVLGTLIVGMGYIGMSLKHLLKKTDFKQLKTFDKIIQSTILGTLSLIFALSFFKIPDFAEQTMLTYVIQHPFIFLVQSFSIFGIIEYWVVLDLFLKRKTKKMLTKLNKKLIKK